MLLEEAKKEDKKVSWWAILLLWGVVILFFIVLNNSGTTNTRDTYTTSALNMSREFVKEKLLSPANAEFALLENSEVRKIDDIYYVDSYVDAKNAYGVSIRKKYKCQMKHKQDSEDWRLIDLKIE